MSLPLNTINLSDNIEFLKTLPDNTVDAIITDSPYGLGKKQNLLKIMQAWITTGYLEISGKGFMGKKWDAFVPQPVLWKECYRVLKPGGYCLSFFGTRTYHLGTLAMELAGFEVRDQIDWIYGSGFPKSKATLKPGHEPIAVCRKPGPLQLLNIDECRIGVLPEDKGHRPNFEQHSKVKKGAIYGKFNEKVYKDISAGRWPSNVIIDETIPELIDVQSGISGNENRTFKVNTNRNGNIEFTTHKEGSLTPMYNDIGGASRFFYCAKASPSERAGMTHPTIKPVKLMTQLVKLFCPVGGIVCDPHGGSGPTAEACAETGRDYILIDNDPVSVEEANGRMERWAAKQGLFNISA